MSKNPLHQGGVASNKLSKKKRIIFEIRRKLVHIFVGSFLSFLIYKDFFFLPICLFLIFGGIILAILIKKKIRIPIFNDFIISFEREKEIKTIPMKGALFFLFGCLLSYLIFGWRLGLKKIAIASILTLAIGDSFVALYGISFGKIKSPIDYQKHFDATIFGVFFNTILISSILHFPFLKVFLASFFALIGEIVIPFEKIENTKFGFVFDDNIFLPLAFGFLLFLI